MTGEDIFDCLMFLFVCIILGLTAAIPVMRMRRERLRREK